MALYTDKASHFKTTRHGGLHYHVEVEQNETQIERALREPGISLINTNSPQAKGKIERKFRFFQDRLIKEMRLRGIKTYKKANRFLKEEFLPWCNERYMQKVESVYRPLSEGVDLDIIFSIRQFRRVNRDNTVSYKKRLFQIPPTNGVRSFSGKWIEVSEKENGRVDLLYEGKKINYVEVSKKGKIEQKIDEEEFMNLRINEKTLVSKGMRRVRKKTSPPPNHP